MTLKTPLYVEIMKGTSEPRVGRASDRTIQHNENTLAVFKFDLEIDERFFTDGAVNSGMTINLTDPVLPASVVRDGLKNIGNEMKGLQQ